MSQRCLRSQGKAKKGARGKIVFEVYSEIIGTAKDFCAKLILQIPKTKANSNLMATTCTCGHTKTNDEEKSAYNWLCHEKLDCEI